MLITLITTAAPIKSLNTFVEIRDTFIISREIKTFSNSYLELLKKLEVKQRENKTFKS